uniref:Short chain dehydrogenase reductase family n=1 Tax=Colletotrichum fructicola (strain Nara gc5) TaxID=1213859 RepID=L2FEL0_COLFN
MGPPPPRPHPPDTPPAERATARFAVTGNAIITGGAGDIGSVACRALLEHGLQGLAIFDLHPDAGQATVNDLKSEFPDAKITFTKVDVTDAEAVSQAVAQTERDIGPINLCFCFAGIAFAIHALDITPEQWRKMFEVNTTGAFLVAQAVAKSMPQVHYNAAKAAILSIKKSLAAEWARYGIRVNSISPGYMDTILNEGEGLEEHRQTWKQRNPYGRMGKPEELTGAVILLASRAGSYITGADILVDGGISVF